MSKTKKKKSVEELLEEALVPEEEQPYPVPENWFWVRLGSISSINMGQSPKGEFTTDDETHTPLIGGPADMGEIYPLTKRYTSKPTKLSKINDLIVSVRATLGKTNIADGEYCLGRGVASISSTIVSNDILRFYFEIMKDYLYTISSGTTFQQISKSDLEKLPFPLAPRLEQEKLCQKVDRLIALVKQAKQLIEEAKETFELRRAAILDKAFRGELTKKWREENPNVDTADVMLDRINETRNKKIEFKDSLDSSVLNTLFELPKTWKWVRLHDLIEESTYGTSAKANGDSEGVAVLRMGNIVNGEIMYDDLKFLPKDHEDVKKYTIETNDLLFNRTNSYELVGKTAVVPDYLSGKATYASYLIRVRLFFKDVLANYVNYYINSHIGRGFLLTMVTQQVGQANINSKKLASLPVPLPPKEEIMEISRLLTNIFSSEKETNQLLLLDSQIETLQNTILSKAFRGELGTNDPTEESALELLKDILQEKVN